MSMSLVSPKMPVEGKVGVGPSWSVTSLPLKVRVGRDWKLPSRMLDLGISRILKINLSLGA